MKIRPIKKGEALAILPEAIQQGPQGMWWDAFTSIPENEWIDSVAVVHVRGSLDHHKGYGCDSYEAIVERVSSAITGVPAADCDESEKMPRPSVVVLRIDSPGGVVSGLNQTVFQLRKLSRESGIPLVAYVDELAASAAYALACACDEIVMPASGICGSIGVISTMYDQVAADEKMGVNFVTLTSGERKADGHPHVAISEAAMAAEQRRVDRLAVQFFNIVADVRPLDSEKIRSYQAGIFLGKEALSAGLVDTVMGWETMMSLLKETGSVKKDIDGKGGNLSPETKPMVGPDGAHGKMERKPMSIVSLKALVKKAETSLSAEKDPKRKKILTASLSAYKLALEAYKKEKHTVEKHETEEGEESEEEAPEEDPPEEKSETKGEDEAPPPEDDDEDEPEETSEESEKCATTSLASLAQQVTGRKGRAAVGALSAMLAQGQRALAKVEAIEKERRMEKKSAAITAALNARKITKHEAKDLQTKDSKFVNAFLEMRPKAIVNYDEETLYVPPKGVAGTDPAVGLPADVVKQIDAAAFAAPDQKSREALRIKLIDAHHARMNGAGRH